MVSRGEFKQMVRAVRAGSSWEQVRAAWSGADPASLDEHLQAKVLEAAGVSPSPVAALPPVVEPPAPRSHHKAPPAPKKRKKG